MNALWITWERQRRNREISSSLNVPLFELTELQTLPKWKKYIIGIFKTLKILVQERPKVVFCQNPSIVLSTLMVLVGLVTPIKIVVDAHYAGVVPHEGKSRILNAIIQFLHRFADITIITTKDHKQLIDSRGGKGFILPDKIPNISRKTTELDGEVKLLFICTFCRDEPFEEVFKAAGLRGNEQFTVYVTGNYKKANIDPSQLPSNVKLTGFVTEERFIELLNSVDGIIDLTNWENCLVCGAYETVAVEKPLLLSDTIALKSYFNKGAVYTDNDRYSIARAMHGLVLNKDQLSKDVKQLKVELQQDWEQRKQQLLELL